MPEVLCEWFNCEFNQDGACTNKDIIKLIQPKNGEVMLTPVISWNYQKSKLQGEQ